MHPVPRREPGGGSAHQPVLLPEAFRVQENVPTVPHGKGGRCCPRDEHPLPSRAAAHVLVQGVPQPVGGWCDARPLLARVRGVLQAQGRTGAGGGWKQEAEEAVSLMWEWLAVGVWGRARPPPVNPLISE